MARPARPFANAGEAKEAPIADALETRLGVGLQRGAAAAGLIGEPLVMVGGRAVLTTAWNRDHEPRSTGVGSGLGWSARRIVVAFAVIAVVESVVFVVGVRLGRADPLIKLGAGPLVGEWDIRFSLRAIPVLLVAGWSTLRLPRLVGRVCLAGAVATTALAGMGFAISLAAMDGWSGLVGPAADRTEFWDGVADAKPAGTYLRDFIVDQPHYSVHVQGHPPGMTLLLLAARSVGLGSPWVVVGFALLGTGLAVGSVAFVVFRLWGSAAARVTMPCLVMAPYAVWQMTSADAFYSGLAAAGVGLLVVAMTTGRRRAAVVAATGGGLVLGGCCFLTFGLPTIAPLIVALGWHTRCWRWVVPATLGAGVPFVLMWLNGYWWLDGLHETRRLYAVSAAAHRPYWYFVIANVAVLAIAVGPAVVAGALRLRRNRAALLVVGGLVCAMVADLSGLSKAETERIWLLYMPWIAVAGASAASSDRYRREWMAVQAGSAILLQATLVSHW